MMISEKERLARSRLILMCDECGRKIADDMLPIFIPIGFIFLCSDCYVDFKHRTQPEHMHYVKEETKV